VLSNRERERPDAPGHGVACIGVDTNPTEVGAEARLEPLTRSVVEGEALAEPIDVGRTKRDEGLPGSEALYGRHWRLATGAWQPDLTARTVGRYRRADRCRHAVNRRLRAHALSNPLGFVLERISGASTA
jgi:hypothetical protein